MSKARANASGNAECARLAGDAVEMRCRPLGPLPIHVELTERGFDPAVLLCVTKRLASLEDNMKNTVLGIMVAASMTFLTAPSYAGEDCLGVSIGPDCCP